MAIHQWPLLERPREKLLARGASVLSDAELLALFLGSGTRGRSALDLARDMLAHTGGLGSLLELDCEQYCTMPGLGPGSHALLQASAELQRRVLLERLQEPEALNAPTLAENYLRSRFGWLPHEVFACLFVDNQHRLIACEELFRGTLDGASVYPREVIKRVLAHNAAAVIFAHNHPSGVAEPSQSDRRITGRLREALELIDVRVLDHFVLARDSVVSFARRGLL